jgi:hypothetical protein
VTEPHSNCQIEAACQRTATAFVMYIDNGRFADLGELFTEDATLKRVTGAVLRGRGQIVEGLMDRPADLRTVHHASPLLVDVTDNTQARGLSSFTVFAFNTTSASTIPRIVAFWDDIYQLAEGRWRIAQRIARVVMSAQ